jgi:hypothetical protein
VNTFPQPPHEQSRLRFCFLAYNKADGESIPPSPHALPFLVALESPGGELGLFIRPDWESFVPVVDHQFIQSLLVDLKDRLSYEPSAVFEQLSTLDLGPLVTCEVGSLASDDPELSDRLRGLAKV